MRNVLCCFIVALAGAAPVAHAQVYRCAGAGGQLTFSDKPCDSGTSGALVQREKSWQEIAQERDAAARAEDRKYRARAAEREQQVFDLQMQQSRQQQAAQQYHPTQRQMQSDSNACKAARKELEFISSIRTVSQDEKRMRTNSAISNVNAACGSNTQLMQEPPKVIVRPSRQSAPQMVTDQRGRPCTVFGSTVTCH
jgi:hypothetical protein